MSDNYFDTTHAGEQLSLYESLAKTQNERIYEYFHNRPGASKSPSQMQAELGMHNVPLTSIRRAMTTLTKEGRLEKTWRKVKGPYNRDEFCWKLV